MSLSYLKHKKNESEVAVLKALSLFAGGGIGETYLHNIGIETVVANELLPERAEIYKYRFPTTDVVIGDIKKKKEELINKGNDNKVELLIATPPCQGMSNIGKRDYEGDERNFLIFDVFDIIDGILPNYVFIENVPKFLDMYYPFQGDILILTDILHKKYGEKYEIKYDVYDASDYGVPQVRKRAFVRMYKKGLKWEDPQKQDKITLREAIGHLPSLESGEDSGIKYHVAPKHPKHHIECLKHTASGKSSHDNPFYYPKKPDGTRIKGYHNTYSRLSWDKVCPTRTMNSGAISGSNNGHPGRLLEDGTYSDARAMSLLELLIVSSLPEDIKLPPDVSEKVVREIIGEGVPPKMSMAFLKMLTKNNV